MKLADKPGSVVDSHSSRRIVADTLKQPTRWRREQRQYQPIWSCCGWRLPRFTRCDANSQARWSHRLVSVALFLALYLAAFNVRPLAVILLCAARTFLPSFETVKPHHLTKPVNWQVKCERRLPGQLRLQFNMHIAQARFNLCINCI